MHPNAGRVAAAAAEHGLVIEPDEFPDGTRTAVDAAKAIGVEVGQIVKSLAFEVDGRIVLALVAGHNRLDEHALAVADGRPGASVRRAAPDAVRAATGFAIGGVPPFGRPTALPTYIDEDLLGFDRVFAAAGTPRHTFGIRPDELVRISGGSVAPIKAR